MPGNPLGKNPAHEDPRHDAPAPPGGAASSSPGRYQIPSPGPGPLPPADPPYGNQPVSRGNHPADPKLQTRGLRKKLWRPMVLAILGLGLLGIGIKLFPSKSESPTPPYDDVSIRSAAPISTITYGVTQSSPSVDRVKIRVYLADAGTPIPPASSAVLITLLLPPGFHFRTCPHIYCSLSLSSAANVYAWSQYAGFKRTTRPFTSEQAIAYLYVKAHDLGETYNGINASVALPQIQYNGPGSPTVAIQYHIPSASSYDWSSFQTLFANDSYAVWPEQLTNGLVAGRAADGINFTNQKQDDRDTFLSGALVGLAGGALLSAVQEALHAND